MFYPKFQLDCSYCKKEIKETAKLLECGESVCVDCENSIKDSLDKNGQFKCKVCDRLHKMPNDGLLLNMTFEKMKNQQPINPSVALKLEELENKLKETKTKFNEFKYYFENREEKVREYCKNIRLEVEMCKQRAIEHLEKECKKLFSEIDEYEIEQIRILNNSEFRNFRSLNDIKSKVNEYCLNIETILVEKKVNKIEEIDQEIKMLQEYKKKLEGNLDFMENALSNSLNMKLNENKEFFEETNKSHLGYLFYENSK